MNDTSKKLFFSVGSADGHYEEVHYKELIFSTIKARGVWQEFTVRDLNFLYPFTNQALALLSGIESAYCGRSFLCAAVLTRLLLDCVLSLCYTFQIDEDDARDFVAEYEKTGELTKPSPKGKRERLKGKDLVKSFRENTGFDVGNAYIELSKMVHPTIHHLYASMKETPESDADFVIGLVGEKTEYPERLYENVKSIIDLCVTYIILLWDSLSDTPRYAYDNGRLMLMNPMQYAFDEFHRRMEGEWEKGGIKSEEDWLRSMRDMDC